MTQQLRRKQPTRPAVAEMDQVVPDDAPLIELGYVPDAVYGVKYVSRDVKGRQDLKILDEALNLGMNVLLYGPTGPGKTSLSLAWAATRKKRFYSVPSNIALDPSQLFGKSLPNATGGLDWHDGGVTDIIRHGGLLLINEVNFMPDRVATVLFSFLDLRREIVLLDHKGERVRAHRPDCWCTLPQKECRDRWVLVVADMNPGYEGTRQPNKALRNRFAIQMEWNYEREVEEKLVKSSTLLDIAYNIRKRVGDDIDTPVSTNMLQEFERLVAALDLDFAIGNFVAHFSSDEAPIIAGVLDAKKDDLADDYVPDDSDYDEFSVGGSAWMYGPRTPSGEAVTPDDEPEED
jgi:nitric oxide reductase NorQ protein